MTSANSFDAGPLSWVKGEIDLALERVAQGLQQFGANSGDLGQIKYCRTHLHQVRGALTIVGLDGATQFTDALEALLTDIEGGKQPADTPRIALIGRSVSSIRRFLDDLIAGDPNQPLRLFDLYAQIAAARGLPAPSASDLFFPDLTIHPQLPAMATGGDNAERLKTARTRYQKGLLALIKSPERPVGALELKLAAQMAAGADASSTLRGFWWAAGGFFTAMGEKSVAVDTETRSLCSRIDQQLRQQLEGSRTVPEKLMRDVLFQVAMARSRNAEVLAIREAFELAALIPAADAKSVSLAAQIEPLLKRLREIASASEEAWNKFCTGSEQSLKVFCEATAALDQGAERLGHAEFRRLIQAVAATAQWVRDNRARHNEAVALEMATGVLLIGNGVDNFTRLGPDFVRQVDIMVSRLNACTTGTPLPRDAEVPVLDEMTRRAQEKLLIAQVVKEIQSSLGQIEQALDTFFREPDQKEQLAGCQKPLGQIVGALSILGHLDAVTQLQASAKQIAVFQSADYLPDQKDFEQVARQLSALGFFVEALQSGVSDYHAFISSLEVKPSKVDTAAESPVASENVAEVDVLPVAEVPPPSAVSAELSEVAPAATPLAIAETAPVPEASPPLVEAAVVAPTPAKEEPVIDAELLEIFLEEAQEVAGTIGEQLEILREHPSDMDALTTLRRAFHTLKGSSRMVGLMEFGEVAWVIEQVHNLWLRQERAVDASLLELVEAAREVFSTWIGHLAGSGEPLPDPTALVAMGEKLKGTETITAPGRPLPSEESAAVSEDHAAETTGDLVLEPASEVSFDLDLPEMEIEAPFAEASLAPEPPPTESATAEGDQAFEPMAFEGGGSDASSEISLTPVAGEEIDLAATEVASKDDVISAGVELPSGVPSGAKEVEGEAADQMSGDAIVLDEAIASPEGEGIELLSLETPDDAESSEVLADVSDSTAAVDLSTEVATLESVNESPLLDLDLSPSISEGVQSDVETQDDVLAIDLVSMVEPPSVVTPESISAEGMPPDFTQATECDVDSIDLVSIVAPAETDEELTLDLTEPSEGDELSAGAVDFDLGVEIPVLEDIASSDGALVEDAAASATSSLVEDERVGVSALDRLDESDLFDADSPADQLLAESSATVASVEAAWVPQMAELPGDADGSAFAPVDIAIEDTASIVLEDADGLGLDAMAGAEALAVAPAVELEGVSLDEAPSASTSIELTTAPGEETTAPGEETIDADDGGAQLADETEVALDLQAETIADADALELSVTESAADAGTESVQTAVGDSADEPGIDLVACSEAEDAGTLAPPALEESSEAPVIEFDAEVDALALDEEEIRLDNADALSIEPQELLLELNADAAPVAIDATASDDSPSIALESLELTSPEGDEGLADAIAPVIAVEESRDEASGSSGVPTLIQIFLEEAVQHVAALQRCFGELEIAPEAPTSLEMVRAAHTLGSISGTVGFPSALKLGRAVEAALLRRDKSANRGSFEALETLRIAIAELESMVAAVSRNEPLADAGVLVSQIDDLYPGVAAETLEAAASSLAAMGEPVAMTELPPAIDEPLPDDQLDESLLPIFLEEAADLVAGINERFGMWSANPYDTDTIHALTRLLHTLKGSARMAGAMRLGALTHRLESSIEAAHRAGGADPVLIAALQADFDDIAELSETLGQEDSERQETTAIEPSPEASSLALEVDEQAVGDAPIDTVALQPSVEPVVAAEVTESAPDDDSIELAGLVVEPLEAMDLVSPTMAPEAYSLELGADGDAMPSGEPSGAEDAAPEIDLDLDLEGGATEFAPLSDTLEPAIESVPERVAPIDDLQKIDEVAALPLETPLVETVEAVAEASAAPVLTVESLPEDHLDEDLLPIFLEEAVELVRNVYEQLDAWQAAPADGAASHALARSLHTLKGSARMAGAMALGALTHTLESRAEEASKSGQVSAALIEKMKHAFDLIAQIVERLQRGEALTDLLASVVSPASEAEPEAPVQAEASPAPDASAPAAPAPVPLQAAAPVAPAPSAAVAPSREAVAAAVSAKPTATAAARKDVDASKAMLRVPAGLIDVLVNDAGELSIARARIEGEMRSLKQSLLDLTENVIRLRRQLREIEIQAESQMQSRTATSVDGKPDFDPLELDRFTRFQEVTRMMAESVNDVATVQLNLLKNLDEANASLAAQARLNRELQQSLMSVRMVPFASITERLQRIVRQTAKELGKRVDLDIQGAGIELDQNVINKMIGPFEHLLRNGISHGIEAPSQRVEQGKDETGRIKLVLRQEGNEVIITMTDDGAGLNFSRIREKAIANGLMTADEPYDERKLTEMIFRSGFSTATSISQIAGRGVGMDVVMTEVTNLGGRIDVSSESGKGSVFRIYLPLTLAVTNAVIVRIGSRYYAIPAAMIDQVRELKEAALADLRAAGGADWLGNHYPFHFLPHLLGEPDALPEARRMYWVLYLHSGLQRVAVQVDELQSSHEIVVKNIGPQLSRVVGIAGATVMGDGRVILILNPVALAARTPVAAPVAAEAGEIAAPAAPAAPVAEEVAHLPTVLVVDDSLTVRKITSRLLAREGYQVFTAKDGQDALEQMVELVPDVILSDIEMPRMDGFELARNIRADERLASIPIIMISSRTADKHRSHATELGVDHFLGKPYQEEELLGLISGYIAEKRARA